MHVILRDDGLVYNKIFKTNRCNYMTFLVGIYLPLEDQILIILS